LKVLFDQNVPRPLRAAESADLDVLLSGDKTIRHEQNMAGRRIAVVYMSDNHWSIVKDHVSAIGDAIDNALPGTLTAVQCGVFIPRRFRVKHDAY
jgi:hypothetical protein